MIVVSDTTPLIALLKINRLDLLKKLFGTIVIPSAVSNELLQNTAFPSEIEQIKQASFIKVIPVKNRESVNVLMRVTGLDIGESEAIILTEEIPHSSLLIDERRGRKVAQMMAIEFTGSLGILLNAQKEGFITTNEAIGSFNQMRLADIRLSEKVYQNFLEKLNQIDRP